MEEIKLTCDTIDPDDLQALSSWILTNPQLTKGPETLALEKEFAEYMGSKYSVFCNSGSSAILLMIYTLINNKSLKNKKIVTNSLGWSTDVSSIINAGLQPILCDVNDKNLSVSLYHLEEIFIKENPSALLLVSALGLSPDMDKICDLCKKYGVILIEDVCESFNTKFKNKKLGTFGDMSCFSFYYSHHISSIEGGMVLTDNKDLYEILISLRSHGWSRDNSPDFKESMRNKWNISEFDELYTFYYPGFNLRSTDLQAFIARRQLKKADEFCQKRYENYNLYKSLLKNTWTPSEVEDSWTSNFCFPIISTKRNEIVKDLIENNIQTRPLISGNLGCHPVYINYDKRVDLPNASMIHEFGFYVPNNHQITKEEIETICSIINKHHSNE